MLKMKPLCERCAAQLRLMDQAYICSYECTFCAQCGELLDYTCPNCSGQLVLRPTRTRSPTEMPVQGFRAKLEKLF